MASFSTTTAAEDRAKAKTLDGTWINAHVQKTADGTIAVRVQRPMSAAGSTNGGWADVTDDSVT